MLTLLRFSITRSARAQLSCLYAIITTVTLAGCQQPELGEREKKRLLSLGIQALPAAEDHSNRYSTDPRAQQFGKQLFFSPALSASGTVSCATCHMPEKGFTDGLARAAAKHHQADEQPQLRNTPTVVGSAWSTWQYWDGRRDSLWSQALTPLEAPLEMATNRVALVRLLLNEDRFRTPYEKIFGPLNINAADLTTDATPMGSQTEKREWYALPKPLQTTINTVFSNLGKALAAYQSTLKPPATRFDQFLQAIANGESYATRLSKQEYAGARLFVNDKKTQCLECHNGPLLSNNDFHHIGSATFTGDNIDFGRVLGVQAAMIDEFNCHGRYSDARQDQCQHLNFMNRNDLVHTQGGFKTPTLRNVANTAPYFHDGRFPTLESVIRHYLTVPATDIQTEIRDFPLTDNEVDALVAFMNTLTTPDTAKP